MQIPEGGGKSTFWMLPIVALLAVLASAGEARPPGPAPGDRRGSVGASQGAPAARAAAGQTSIALSLVDAFLGPASSDETDGNGNPGPSLELEFLIATLPDPAASRLDYTFDRHFDSIQRAIEEKGFILDRYALPWSPGGARDAGKEPAADQDPRPGVVLYRRNDGKGLLVLFVVGETATKGIDRPALLDALQQISLLTDTFSSRLTVRKNPYRIVGPTFSGSARSLEQVIRHWRRLVSTAEFRIVTGSATAIPWKQGIDGMSGVTFRRAVNQDKRMLELFLQYLRCHGVEESSVALLIESSTGYGQSVEQSSVNGGQLPPGCEGREVHGVSWDQVLRVPFPIHVADLRRRRENQSAVAPRSGEMEDLLNPGEPLPAEKIDPGRETPPVYSELESASVGPLLESVLVSLSRERIRYVGVVATDIRDAIFLGLQVRKHAPNTVLFSLSADNLFLHPGVHAQLQGMLILGSYPLSPLNRLWSPPYQERTERLQFPTANAQGVYNAALAVLGSPQRMLEYGEPLSRTNGFIEEDQPPPVWLTAVGGNGFWPIASLSMPPLSGAAGEAGSAPDVDLDRGLSEGGPVVLLILWCLTGALVALDFHRLLPPQPHCETRPGSPFIATCLRSIRIWSRRLAEGPRPGRDFEQQLNVLAGYTALLDVHLLILAIWCLPLAARLRAGLYHFPDTRQEWSRVLPLLFAVALALLLFAGFVLSLARIAGLAVRQGLPRRSRLRWNIYLLTMSIVTVALCIRQGVAWLSLDPAGGMMLFARATSPGSGLSPLVPSVLAGLAIFALVCCTLRRTHLREEGAGFKCDAPRFPHAGLFHEVKAHEARVSRLFDSTPNELPGLLGVLALFSLLLGALLLGNWAPTLEAPPFDGLFKVVWAMAYLLVALEFVRFSKGWMELRQLLRRLRQHPTFAGYGELREIPAFSKATPARRTTILAGLHVCVDRARELAGAVSRSGADASLCSALKGEVERLNRGFQRLQDHQERATWAASEGERPAYLEHLRSSLACLDTLTAGITAVYEPAWRLESVPESGDPKSARSERQLMRLGQQFLASRFVLFIQHTIRHLQNQVFFIMVSLLLMLLAVTSYPFQPRGWLLLFNWSLILTAVFSVLYVFLQMNRNEILSELMGTTPGALSLDRQIVGRVLVYGFIPILGLLRAQYPGTLEQMVAWVRRLLGGWE